MTRVVWCLLAAVLLLVGLVMTIGFALILAREWDWAAFFGLLVAVLFASIGATVVAVMPYQASASPTGLDLAFIFGKRHVSWDEIEAYRPLALNVSFRPGEAGVWTLLRYRTRGNSRPRARRAVFCLRGEGPGFGLLDEYKTLLDLSIPHRKTR